GPRRPPPRPTRARCGRRCPRPRPTPRGRRSGGRSSPSTSPCRAGPGGAQRGGRGPAGRLSAAALGDGSPRVAAIRLAPADGAGGGAPAGSRTGGRLGRRAPRPGPAPIGPVRALAAGDGLPVATGARARSAGGGGRRDRGRRIVGARVREGEPPLPTADRRAE